MESDAKSLLGLLQRALENPGVLGFEEKQWAVEYAFARISPDPSKGIGLLVGRLSDREAPIYERWTVLHFLGKLGPKAQSALPSIMEFRKFYSGDPGSVNRINEVIALIGKAEEEKGRKK